MAMRPGGMAITKYSASCGLSQVPRILQITLDTVERSNVGWLDLIVNSFWYIGDCIKCLLRLISSHQLLKQTTNDFALEGQNIIIPDEGPGSGKLTCFRRCLMSVVLMYTCPSCDRFTYRSKRAQARTRVILKKI
ncbi:hypothetical protein BIW11_10483 [Tropilaelaps mercedesae]|uniref:Uncharacterized protein n=1 Tax=Tropilaelaps mercedesae TaxID=418985 RepID=A0A1V9XFT9_9ACAR|nr:hypothetical protein BIW11_10483 [Tropilaelaps mercedesae]